MATIQDLEKKLNKTEGEEPKAYTGKYDQQMEKTANAILNRQPFSYNFNADPLYQQYRNQYMQNGRLAMQDTMADAAALSGGYGNSYAATAGNQAYQQSLAQLNNVIPELYQAAYNRYTTEGDNMRNNLSMLQGMDDRTYGRWQDQNTLWQNKWTNQFNQYSRILEHNEHAAEVAHAENVLKLDKEKFEWEKKK